jgi:Dockerin type I domain
MTVAQSTPESFSNNLSCTIVPLATGTGTIDLASRKVTGTATFSDGEVVTASGQISLDGNTVTGTWCTPGCTYNGAMTWTRIAASYSADMTQVDGGSLSTALGDTLTVPPEALPSDQRLTIALEPLPIAPPSGYGSLRTAYEFGPSGLTFNSPLTVTAVFHYSNGDIPPGVRPENLRVYVLQAGVWSFVGGTVDTVAMTVTVQLSHFSTYGVFAQLAAPVSPMPRDHKTDANGDGYSAADEVTVANCGVASCASITTFGTAETRTCKDVGRMCGTPNPPADESGSARVAIPPADGYGCSVTLDTVGPKKTTQLARSDVDLDGTVSILDLSKVASWFGNTINPSSADPRWEGDMDGDGHITILDLSAMASNFGRSVAGNCKIE